MRFILSWPQREFHRSVTVKMPTRSMVHETASFYWHGIQSVPPGYMSLALLWGPPIAAAPCISLPNPIYTHPPSHHHSTPCVNTISPVKKGTTTCFLVLLFLIDYAKYPSVPPHAFAIRQSWLGARWSSPILLHPTLWPHPPLPHIEREVTERHNRKLTTKVKLQKRSKRRLHEHTFPVLLMRN